MRILVVEDHRDSAEGLATSGLADDELLTPTTGASAVVAGAPQPARSRTSAVDASAMRRRRWLPRSALVAWYRPESFVSPRPMKKTCRCRLSTRFVAAPPQGGSRTAPTFARFPQASRETEPDAKPSGFSPQCPLITLIASLYPAILAARMEPVEALHAQ